MEFKLFHYPADISEALLLEKMDEINTDDSVSGYIVQLPLPKHIDTQKIFQAINPNKDVD
jgi:methylenetetrahydrofolate dehydrogenase (NADP+)/methenyltetrahydrofolate cyclohydrolase